MEKGEESAGTDEVLITTFLLVIDVQPPNQRQVQKTEIRNKTKKKEKKRKRLRWSGQKDEALWGWGEVKYRSSIDKHNRNFRCDVRGHIHNLSGAKCEWRGVWAGGSSEYWLAGGVCGVREILERRRKRRKGRKVEGKWVKDGWKGKRCSWKRWCGGVGWGLDGAQESH